MADRAFLIIFLTLLKWSIGNFRLENNYFTTEKQDHLLLKMLKRSVPTGGWLEKLKKGIFDRNLFIHSTQSQIIPALLSTSATPELSFSEWSVRTALK